MHLPPFLREQYTPNTLWLFKLSKGILQPSYLHSYQRAGLHGLTLVSLLLDLRGISTTHGWNTSEWLGWTHSLPCLCHFLSTNPEATARSTGSPPGAMPLVHRYTETGEEIPFLFPYHHFTVFVLSLICCSLVDIKSLYTLSPGHSQPL